MTSRARVLLIAALASACALASPRIAGAEGLPAPPGFEWVVLDDLRARFLKPIEWQASISKGKLMSSLVLRANASNSESNRPARFTVNVVSNLAQSNFQPVSRQLRQFSDDLANSHDSTVRSRTAIRRGDYVGESIVRRVEQTDSAPRVEQRLYLAHERRDWLMIVSFECAEASWTRLRTIRETLVGGFVLD